VVLDEEYARSLRLTLAAEHLDRLAEVEADGLEQAMADCVEPAGQYDAYATSAARLEAWHRDGRADGTERAPWLGILTGPADPTRRRCDAGHEAPLNPAASTNRVSR